MDKFSNKAKKFLSSTKDLQYLSVANISGKVIATLRYCKSLVLLRNFLVVLKIYNILALQLLFPRYLQR